MITRKITFYKPEERMPKNKTIVLIVTLGGRMESAVYRNGRFYEPEEQFYYTPVEDVEFWASADWDDPQEDIQPKENVSGFYGRKADHNGG